jgi:predicted acetyltransferase
LRRITVQSLADMRERGQSVAALWASQAAIYQRYGYALASAQLAYRIDPLDVGFADGDGGTARVARVAGDAGFETIKRVYIEFVANRIGYLHRARPMWLNNALSTAQGPVHIAVASRDDRAVGYVTYHLRDSGSGHFTRNQEIIVRDLAWLDADAYRSLWSWLKRHDLVGRIIWPSVPVDDPAGELFVEPRLLHAEMRDGVWLRVVDAAVALAARGYSGRGALTLEIAGDDLAPWNVGRFALDADADEATVRNTAAAADVRLSVKALASLYSGYRSARQLKSWGLLDANDDAVARTDALFATRHAPHCPDNF